MPGDRIDLSFPDEVVECIRVHRWRQDEAVLTFLDTSGTMVTLKLGPRATKELRREWNIVSQETLKGE